MKAVREISGISPKLGHCRYKLVLSISPTAINGYEKTSFLENNIMHQSAEQVYPLY